MPTKKGRYGKRGATSGNRVAISRSRNRAKSEDLPTATLSGGAGQKVIQITIFKPSPSANAWVYKHWRYYYRIKKEWLEQIYIAIKLGGVRLDKPLEQVRIHAERHSIRLLDQDNMIAGLKPIQDALVTIGILTDDTSDLVIDITGSQVRVPHKADQKTIVTVSECQPTDSQSSTQETVEFKSSEGKKLPTSSG